MLRVAVAGANLSQQNFLYCNGRGTKRKKRKKMKARGTLAVLMFVVVAIASLDASRGAESAGHTGDSSAVASPLITGKVIEVLSAGRYTYVQVEVGTQKVWAASSPSKVKAGEVVSFAGDLPMENFESKALKRTFEKIYFVGRLHIQGEAVGGQDGSQLPPGHPPVGEKADAASGVDIAKIEKAPGGKSIAEVYAGKESLAGKKVTVRGMVVRFNESILNRNWIRLQDASCQGAISDLAVTSREKVEKGRIVTVSGVLATNKDFGYGYRYEVLLEDAAVSAQ